MKYLEGWKKILPPIFLRRYYSATNDYSTVLNTSLFTESFTFFGAYRLFLNDSIASSKRVSSSMLRVVVGSITDVANLNCQLKFSMILSR